MKKLSITAFSSFFALSAVIACGSVDGNQEDENGLGGGGANTGGKPATGGALSASGGSSSSTGGKHSATGGAVTSLGGGGSSNCDSSAPKPILYLSGDGNLEDTITGATASVTGDVTLAAAQFDQGIAFSPKAGGSYLTAPASETLEIGTSDFSIAFWVKMTSGFEILDKRVEAEITGYSVYVYNGNVGIQLANGGAYNNFNSTNAVKVNDGAWHHVAITVDRDSTTGLRFYQDGSLIGTMNPTAYQGTLSSAAPLYIAAHAFNQSSTSFTGTLDELQIYASVLSPEEIAALGTAAAPDFCQ